MQSCIVTWNHWTIISLPFESWPSSTPHCEGFLGKMKASQANFGRSLTPTIYLLRVYTGSPILKSPASASLDLLNPALKGRKVAISPIYLAITLLHSRNLLRQQILLRWDKSFFCKRTDMAGRVWTGDRCFQSATLAFHTCNMYEAECTNEGTSLWPGHVISVLLIHPPTPEPDMYREARLDIAQDM